MDNETEIKVPHFWDKRVLPTLIAIGLFVSTIVGVTFAADERWAKNSDVSEQFSTISQDMKTAQVAVEASITEVKTDLTIKIRSDERTQAQSRLYELQDRMAIARDQAQRQDFLNMTREQEEKVRALDKELDRLTTRKAQAVIVRSGITAPMKTE